MIPRLLAALIVAIALTPAAPALAQPLTASAFLAPSLIRPVQPLQTHYGLVMSEAVSAVAAQSPPSPHERRIAAEQVDRFTSSTVRYNYGPTGLGDAVSTFGFTHRF